MALTINDVIHMDVLRPARVLTTSHNPDTAVGGISIMEAPDIVQWVGQNEIILTSLYAVLFDKRLMEEFIESLKERKICALLIKTKRYINEVPADILRAAEELGIAVLEIPPDLPYKDIMYPVMAAVFDNEVIQLNYYKKTRNLLTGYALKNVGLEGITEAFSELVGRPVIICGREGETIYATTPHTPQPGSLVVESELLLDGVVSAICRGTRSDGVTCSYFVMPIFVLDAQSGSLMVETGGEKFTETELIATQNALVVISQEMLKTYTANETKRNQRLELIDDIISGSDPATLQESALRLGWNLSRGYSPGVAEFSAAEEGSLSASYPQGERQTELIGRAIRELMERHGLTGIAECRRQRVILLLEQPAKSGEKTKQKLEAFYRALVEEIAALPAVRTVKAGYSSRCVPLGKIADTYKNALSALQSCAILRQGSHAVDYESLGLNRLLTLVQTREDLKEFIPAKIIALQAYDEQKASSLIETLEEFFRSGRNLKKAAEALYIHHKTMAYRLRRIEEITGIALSDQDELLELEFGLKVFRLSQELP